MTVLYDKVTDTIYCGFSEKQQNTPLLELIPWLESAFLWQLPPQGMYI